MLCQSEYVAFVDAVDDALAKSVTTDDNALAPLHNLKLRPCRLFIGLADNRIVLSVGKNGRKGRSMNESLMSRLTKQDFLSDGHFQHSLFREETMSPPQNFATDLSAPPLIGFC